MDSKTLDEQIAALENESKEKWASRDYAAAGAAQEQADKLKLQKEQEQGKEETAFKEENTALKVEITELKGKVGAMEKFIIKEFENRRENLQGIKPHFTIQKRDGSFAMEWNAPSPAEETVGAAQAPKRGAEEAADGALPTKKAAKDTAPGRGRFPSGTTFKNGKFVKDPDKQKEWLKKSETHTWDETGGSGDRSGLGDWVPKEEE